MKTKNKKKKIQFILNRLELTVSYTSFPLENFLLEIFPDVISNMPNMTENCKNENYVGFWKLSVTLSNTDLHLIESVYV